ncbi:fructan beta-fructosidase [Spirosomataceae bacterium TFI 002]|nr:fructan beta-fructosidase [Spirosomataceae bacterium TFI 002]
MKQSYASRLLFLLIPIFSILFGCNNGKVVEDATTSSLYQENHRPQFHFTPEANWMNDPNGMFYKDGEYHLFYQYYPDSTVWGPMHWGHAVSSDLVSWKHLPIGLYPDSLGYIFSGSAVVDLYNTSKLGTAENPPIVAAFTHHNMDGERAQTNDFQTQSIAYSLDGGTKWTKYKGNPVIPNTDKIKDFRDPKVIWHEPSKSWILTLAAYEKVKFYSSPNLIDWKFLSDYGIKGDTRLWECPDLFPIKVEGTDETKWVLIVSIQKDAPNAGTATSYFVGEFDGKEFKSDVKNHKWLDWGTDNYAFVTWDNLPKDDGRVLGIGWMSNWQYAQIVPTEKWRSAMTLPRELKLIESKSGYLLQSSPTKEFLALRGETTTLDVMNITEEKLLEGNFKASQSELNFTIDLKKTTANTFGLKLQNDLGENLLVKFDKTKGKMYVDRSNSSKEKFSEDFFKKDHSAPINFGKEKLNVRMIIDAASIEIFINEGEVSFTSIFFPTKKFDTMSLFAEKGTWSINNTKIYALNSIW